MVRIAGLVTLVAALCIVAVALFVGLRARVAVANGNAPVYRVRKYYAAVLAVVLIGLMAFTLPRTPYAAHTDVAPAAHVRVTGRMWSWEMQRRGPGATAGALVLPVGRVIAFDVTSADVNHGFGVYDDQGHLLGQAQAMPGYVNQLRLVFDTPGRYHVLCLEYCGLIHHTMATEFTVR